MAFACVFCTPDPRLGLVSAWKCADSYDSGSADMTSSCQLNDVKSAARQNGGAQRESEAPVVAQPGSFVAKKSKAAAKKGTGTTQWAILQQSGIPPEDIHMFRYAPALPLCGWFCIRISTGGADS